MVEYPFTYGSAKGSSQQDKSDIETQTSGCVVRGINHPIVCFHKPKHF